ncbi:MAG: LysM peptidoglycan-binding domain-containing protein [Flavobacteriales bacterium]|nr:LysM peptidoglycan-binding domain-containing protein [Flavobacteriales bacterium]
MMRNFLLALFLFGCCAVQVQSQEVRMVNGEKYLVHTVAPGETLFGLSRHYAVPLEAITGANPAAAEGLSVGQVLLVPVKEQSKKELKNAPALGNGELLHTVARKETIYGIARRYGVGQEDLRRWNPELGQGLTIGMVLRIQVAASIAAPPSAVLPAVTDQDEFHLVQPGETLFALAKRFDLSVEKLKEANGNLPEGLKAGTYLRIPRVAAPQAPDTALRMPAVPKPVPSAHRRIAVLLPFTASDSAIAGEEEMRSGSATDAAMQFRAGLGLALDTLQARGLNAEVHVFDTGMKPEQWNKLFKSDAVRGMDLYIGPFHRAAIEGLVKVSGSTPLVCPVPQSNKVVLGNPSVSKAVGGRTDRLKFMARHVAATHGRDNILLLKPEIHKEREVQDLVARELQQALQSVGNKLRDSLLVVPCSRRDAAAAVGKLDPARPNILVVPSEDVEFITAVLAKFSSLVPKYAITVYGMHAWTTLNTLDVAAMVKLNVHVPASAHADLSSPAVNEFIAAYRARYANEPGEYAFLGYDVALYFIQGLMQYGKDFPAHYAPPSARPLYLDFRMAKLGPENGWNNSSAVMLRYFPEGLLPAR